MAVRGAIPETRPGLILIGLGDVRAAKLDAGGMRNPSKLIHAAIEVVTGLLDRPNAAQQMIGRDVVVEAES